jgi:hypothetical protein
MMLMLSMRATKIVTVKAREKAREMGKERESDQTTTSQGPRLVTIVMLTVKRSSSKSYLNQ